MDEIPYGESWGWQFNDGRISGKTSLYESRLVDGKPIRVVVITLKDFLKIKNKYKLKFKPCIPAGEGTSGWTKDHKKIEETKIQMDDYWDDKLRRL